MSTNDKNEDVSNTNHCSSFFKNSCTGNGFIAEEKAVSDRDTVVVAEAERAQNSNDGWSKSLSDFPGISESGIEKTLITGSISFPKRSAAPKSYRHKKQGYKLWKEGYVQNIFLKPNVKAQHLMFLIKCRVHASMKNIFYNVYVHLNQRNGDVIYSKCNCKAGQGGCCKHVAALLYTLLDFSNLELKRVPDTLTCTQVAQKWHVPSSTNLTMSKAVKFDDVSFSNTQPNKPSKRAFGKTARENYSATPSFAKKVSSDTLKHLVNNLQNSANAGLFCKVVASNDCQPTNFFEKSIKNANMDDSKNTENELENDDNETIYQVFENIANENFSLCKETIFEVGNEIEKFVGVSKEKAIDICIRTKMQRKDPEWYEERRKRVTASHFGKIMNRRKSIEPKSIIADILKQSSKRSDNMPAPLKWGIENEKTAINKYLKTQKDGVIVKDCGLVIDLQYPWLACSPDGVILKDNLPIGCVEVKSPFAKRELTLQQAVKDDKNFFLKKTDNGLTLKKNHIYFYQCQGVVNILNLPWIDFIVYTEVDLHVERVFKDASLWKNIMVPELTRFYQKHIFNELLD